MDVLNKIKNTYKDDNDLIIRKLKNNTYLVFFASLCSLDKIHYYIFENINKLPSGNIKDVKKDEIDKYLFNGYAILISNKIIAVEVKADLFRDISTNETEPSIKGPKNAFTENYQTNLGLIKKRIKSNDLKTKDYTLGSISKTLVSVLYIDGICNDSLVKSISNKLDNINNKLINSSEDLLRYLSSKTIFPTVISTERPDRVSEALIDGKIAIICDESSNVLIVPGYLIDFIHPFSDRYNKAYNINFTKVLRLFCFLLSIMIPAFYIAIINYNQEALPYNLIINFASQRSAVPFPSIIECLIMLIICEILRESDMRFPAKYGSAISILGALILGEAAVSAGLVTPIILIITSFTYISSLLFSDLEFSNAIRTYRFVFLIASAFYGLYGVMISFMFLMIRLTDIKVGSTSYTFPLSPYNKNYFKEFFFKDKKENK